MRAAVGIVFYALDLARHMILVAPEIDNAIALLVPAADMTCGDATQIVAAARALLGAGQRAQRSAAMQFLTLNAGYETSARRCRFGLYNGHVIPISACAQAYSAPSEMSLPGASWTYAFFQSERRPRRAPGNDISLGAE